MFTGLVQAVGVVKAIGPHGAGVRLAIDPQTWKHSPKTGDSIAIDGVCLTVAGKPSKRQWNFDVIPQTLAVTTLGKLKSGQPVNLEHAATASTLFGGHLVQGHIDGVGRVESVQRGSDWRIRIAAPSDDFAQYLTPKGSICVAGVSLTIAGVWKRGRVRGFEVALIPTTLAMTTLGDLTAGDSVNLEADTIAKTVVFWLRNFSGGRAAGRKGA